MTANQASLVSVDALANCIEVATEAGFDILPYLRRRKIDPDLIAGEHGLIDYSDLIGLLEEVASCENCPDFGFRLAQGQRPLQFGMISQTIAFAPTVGEAIDTFLKYRALYSQSSHWELKRQNGIAQLRRFWNASQHRDGMQIVILNITKSVMAVRALMGPEWSPIGVYFVADNIPVTPTMRRYFNAPMFFGSQNDEIAFPEADLGTPISTGNPELLAVLTNYFDRLLPDLTRHGQISVQVQRILRTRMGNAPCAIVDVANAMAMHPRTLQRALANEGTAFRTLARDLRMQMARQLTRSTRMPIMEVSTLAGYRHASSFTRAYRQSEGQTPRTQRATGPQD